MNGNPLDNDTPFNLVICPDQSYHMLLHKRAKEYWSNKTEDIAKELFG
jgi:hypothetical protein